MTMIHAIDFTNTGCII